MSNIANEIWKLTKAINTLKANTFYTFRGDTVNESSFNNIEWDIGSESNGDVKFTTTNPHSEITWTKVKEEMDKL
tara:strand:- start:484 stop:708 length:225 start_codon:yes stop_codon:yes gene_type:complete